MNPAIYSRLLGIIVCAVCLDYDCAWNELPHLLQKSASCELGDPHFMQNLFAELDAVAGFAGTD